MTIRPFKVLQNGIRFDGEYIPCWYDISSPCCVTVYARNYKSLPEFLCAKNDSDSMTDYFENDRLVVSEDHKYFNDFMMAAKKRGAKRK